MSTSSTQFVKLAVGIICLLSILAVLPTASADESDQFTTVGYNWPRYCPCPDGDSMLAEGQSSPGLGDMAGDLSDQAFGGLGSGTWSINDTPGGYIDNPIVATWFRARYDVAINNPHPDLAEFFYAKYGPAGGPGVSPPAGFNSPTSVNYQVGTAYFELLVAPRLSVFGELAVQRTDIFFPDGAGNVQIVKNGGLGDTIAGLKYALYVDECQYLTFQFKTYAPSGDPARGLGTGHVSLEPGLLYISRLSDRAYFQGELRYWIPVDGTDYAGKVLRYGAGIGYDIYRTSPVGVNPYIADGWRVTAVGEFVGWSVWDAKFTPGNVPGVVAPSLDVPDGFTVMNVKPGVRLTHGLASLYFGSGIAVSGDRWYSDLFRIEYRRMF